jgi:C4-dicarboxylate-specific signal transduction histidine kinase
MVCFLGKCVDHGDSRNLTSFAKVVRDITEHKASEQRLRDSERLATLGTTAAAFAHEVANPLNGLSSCLEIVGNLLDDSHNPALKETVQAADQEMSRLISLLADYRSFARPQILNIQPSNLRKIVEEVLAPNIHNYQKLGVSVTVQFDEDLPLVPVDPEKISK